MKKSVGKFFLKCILATFPLVVLCLYTALFPFGYMDEEYPSWKYQKDMAMTGPAYDTLILGDSTAKAGLIPNNLSSNVINLSMGGATPIEIYYTLERYLASHEAPENALIMFTPYHYSFLDNFWQRTMYFNYFDSRETLEVFRNAHTVSETAVLTDGYFIDLMSYRLRLPNKYLPAMYNSGLIGRRTTNEAIYNEIASNRGQYYFGTADGCSDHNYESNYTALNLSPIVDLYMRKLLDLCVENNIHVVLEQAPMNTASYSLLNENYVTEYTAYMELLQQDYPEIMIDTIIAHYEDAYFGDASHLNEKGAVRFTEEILTEYPELFTPQN